jgi:hypothetical protein
MTTPTTYCAFCDKALPSTPALLAHLPVFAFDGDLDYIELAHRGCAPDFWRAFDGWPKTMTDSAAWMLLRSMP